MASNRRGLPEINAGSMADIAFLLLIFFLVTTTMDTPFGISTKLPPMPEENVEPPEINERNILLVLVNTQNQLLINNEFNDITTLKNRVKRFVTKDADNPKKAIVSLQCLDATEYGMYIQVQDEIAKAYKEIRNDASLMLFSKQYLDLEESERDIIQDDYPKLLSEAEPRTKTGK